MSRLSRELIAELAAMRNDGVPIKECCRRVKLSTETFYDWKRRGEAGENGLIQEFFEQVIPLHKHRGDLDVPDVEWRRIDVFQGWASTLVLDSGEVWEPELWQLDAVEDVLSDLYQAVWLIVPEGNGKTTLVAAIVLYLLEHQLTPEIPIGSATVTQAETLFRQIEGFIYRSDKLKDFNLAPGVRRIDCRRTHGHTRVYPHNERSGDGVIPSAWVLDEGHLHPDLRLYRLWKGKYRKRRGVGIGISTAGEPNSEFEELRANLLLGASESVQDGPHIRAVNGNTVIHDYAVRDPDKVEDLDVVEQANPLELIDKVWLGEKRAEPEMTESHWLRRTCNIAAREGGVGIDPVLWDAGRERWAEPDMAGRVIGWLDLGWTIDTTAMGVLVWESHERRLICAVNILEPPVDEADIVRGILDIQEAYSPEGFVYDPNAGGQQIAQLLEKRDHPVQVERNAPEITWIEHSQDNAPMCQAAARFDEALRNGWIVHDGDKGLRKHALSAVKRSVGGEKWRYDRPPEAKGAARRKFPNDALIGVVMGHNVAVDLADAPANDFAFL